MLLNLASACNTEDPDVLWGFISRYDDGVSPENSPIIDRLSNYAITYYKDFVKPEKRYRAPTDAERSALEDLVESLLGLPIGADAAAIQNEVFLVGKKNDYENLRDWFKALYEILLGREQGPRMGSFIALYGIAETVDLIKQVLDGQDISGS